MNVQLEDIRKLCDASRHQAIDVDGIVIEAGAIQQLPDIMKEYYGQAKNVVMICDDHTYEAAGKLVEKLLPDVKTVQLDSENLHADEHGVAQAEKGLEGLEVDFMIACGSGTIHDITRYHAYEKGLSFLSIPTAASVDGFVSTVAAMTWHGFKKSFTAVSPRFVLADTEIFSKAPNRLTASGVGDLIGKYISLADWRISTCLTNEYLSEPVVELEYKVLSDLVENLDGIGQGDLVAFDNLMYGLLLSGLAMQMVGNSRPASGAEHHCSHLWEMGALNKPIDFLHGEKVGVGTCLIAGVYEQAKQRLINGEYHVKDKVDLEEAYIRSKIQNSVLLEEVLKENTPNLLDTVDPKVLKEKEKDIIEILNDVPSQAQFESWMKKVNGLWNMSQLTLDEKLLSDTLRLSPYVRQRLTFMRTLKFYDFYEALVG